MPITGNPNGASRAFSRPPKRVVARLVADLSSGREPRSFGETNDTERPKKGGKVSDVVLLVG